MKKYQKNFTALGMVLFAAGFVFSASPAQATSAPGMPDGETVSVIGTPSGPTPMPSGEVPPMPIPSGPDSISPQHMGVAPSNPSPSGVVPYAKPQPLPQAIATPAQEGLMPGVTTPPEALSGQSQGGGSVLGNTDVRPKHSGTYYDANAIVPDSALSRAGVTGTRKVDPALEPGQKFIVVDKTRNASSFEAQYTAATRAVKLGRYAAAMEMFEKLHAKNPRDPRILMGLAVAQQGAGFNESAAQTYEDLLKVQPNNADAIINLMGIMKTQYPAVTMTKLKELRSKYPNNAGIPAQLGLVNAGMKNYDDAIRYLEVAASMEPRNPSHIYNMAIIKDTKGDALGAINLYERALQMDASYGDVANGLPREQIYDRLVVLRRKV